MKKNARQAGGKKKGGRRGRPASGRGDVSAQVRQIVLILADPEAFPCATSRAASGTRLRACFWYKEEQERMCPEG